MLKTTTSVVEGHPVKDYLGVVVGEAILGARWTLINLTLQMSLSYSTN